jgi:hypothetical protein
LHGFATGVILMRRLQGNEGGALINDSVKTICNSAGLFKGLRVSKFDFRACLGFQSTDELVDESFFIDFSKLHCELC